MKLIPGGRGRPRKFGRPARAITLTLPIDIIAALTAVDDDVSRAVVRLVQPVVADVVPRAPAELSRYAGRAVIVTKPVAALKRIAGVTLVPLPDGRALISLEHISVDEFELRLRDAIDDARTDGRERPALTSIAEILRSARRTKRIAIVARSIIVLQSTGRRRARDSRAASLARPPASAAAGGKARAGRGRRAPAPGPASSTSR
jgi:hypothetical protein